MVWREGIVACVLDEVKQRKLTNYSVYICHINLELVYIIYIHIDIHISIYKYNFSRQKRFSRQEMRPFLAVRRLFLSRL